MDYYTTRAYVRHVRTFTQNKQFYFLIGTNRFTRINTKHKKKKQMQRTEFNFVTGKIKVFPLREEKKSKKN